MSCGKGMRLEAIESATGLVLLNDDVGNLDLAEALNEVSPERRAYAMSYRFERDRRLSVAAYLLLKEALRRAYGIAENPRLARGPAGKPFLPDHPGIHFNFSHCARAAACIVSDRPVGIDVEEIAEVDWTVARRVLSEDEIREVRAADAPEIAFARCWTRKEALVKLSGAGLDDDRLPTLLADSRDAALETVERLHRGYVLTTAWRAAPGPPPAEPGR